jgi:peptidylprolyl isomerase
LLCHWCYIFGIGGKRLVGQEAMVCGSMIRTRQMKRPNITAYNRQTSSRYEYLFMKNTLLMRYLFIAVLILFVNFHQHCRSSKLVNQYQEKNDLIESASGLKYKILREGTGDTVTIGQEILLHETMSYRNDSLLFDSRKLPNPIKVLIGGDQVIKGIDEGLIGMRKGEIKKLIVPPSLSKRKGVQTFPHPDSTLVYEIELIDILKN